ATEWRASSSPAPSPGSSHSDRPSPGEVRGARGFWSPFSGEYGRGRANGGGGDFGAGEHGDGEPRHRQCCSQSGGRHRGQSIPCGPRCMGIRQRNHRGGGGLTSSLARLNRRRRASKTT
ncbi:unnamed protein product, partial [Musa banksii]